MSKSELLIPELKGIGTWDKPDLSQWWPPDPDRVATSLTLEIGTEGEDGADSFTALVATPAGLQELASEEGLLAVGRMVVFERFDHDVVTNWFKTFVASCAAPTWEDCVKKLQKNLAWEYEDYVVSPASDD